MNTALFAQSVIMWSFPTLFYVRNGIENRKMFEFELNGLQETMAKYLKLLDEPRDASLDDFERLMDVALRQVNDVLVIAESFLKNYFSIINKKKIIYYF